MTNVVTNRTQHRFELEVVGKHRQAPPIQGSAEELMRHNAKLAPLAMRRF
jgi:hypothetical protein